MISFSSSGCIIGRFFLICIIYFISGFNLNAQIIGIPTSDPLKPIVERMMMKVRNSSNDHASHQYFTRKDILQLLKDLDTLQNKSTKDIDDIQYLLNECDESATLTDLNDNDRRNINRDKDFIDSTKTFYSSGENSISGFGKGAEKNEYPLFNIFYKNPANFIQVDQPNFYLRINPVFNFNYGRTDNSNNSTTFKNIRGAEMRGGIADRIFFYANIHETQEAYPSYINEWIAKYGAVPGAGFNKSYQPSFLKKTSGVDYLNSQGMIGFKIMDEMTLQFGHGRNFIGDGYRSLFLSDFAANYFYLK